MAFEIKSLRSRVSKRIFTLFVLSAFIPLLTISLISFKQISEQLYKESKRQVYRESRALGLTIYDRFLSLETNLKLISNILESSSGRISMAEDIWLRSIFSSIYILNPEGEIFPLFGKPEEPIKFRDKEKEHLLQNKTLIQFQPRANNPATIMLIQSLDVNSENPRYIVGIVNELYMWEQGIDEPDIYCAVDKFNFILYCSTYIGENQGSIFSEIEKGSEDNFNYWQINDTEYAIYMCSIFLKAHFLSDNITVAMARPKETMQASFKNFKNIFPEALIITGLLVALLSITQIRKSLGPLEKLIKGTERIARGEFNEPVKIDSGDEFEALADSFNEMRERVNDQFRMINALADIDRQILSTLDRSYIIETVIRHLHNIVETNHVCVITIENIENGSLILHVNMDGKNSSIEKRNITIGASELTELMDCQNYMLLDENDERVYTKALIEKGDRSFLIFPVHAKKELSAFICISADKKMNFDENKLLQLREMADRVAVALSNAAWEEKLFQQAHYDLLTQLPNRLYFKNRMEQELELARRNRSNIAILFIDLDRFKNINDSLGHVAGDQVLIQMGEMLESCVRKSEVIARLGGDEFVVIMSETESEEAVSKRAIKLSHRIIQNMRKPFRLGHREIYITPSIGIALYPRDADNYSDLLKNADTAMYEAKDAGGDCYKFYNKEQNENMLELLDLENDLRHAIERNELGLLYQPIICCESGNVIGAEALLRWEHPELGVLQPDAFISLAEDTGMITIIGYWVLKTACLQNMKWRDKDVFEITMAVNISADQFQQIDLYDSIKNILEETGMLPKYLELEITESITIENFTKTIDVLDNLKKLGIVIAIDDFGTGYSSLSYLQQFPIDKVKIDRSFIKNITENEDSVSIVKAIIALAHSLKLTVIAEGVETQAQYDLLRNMNCDEAQGFYFGPAISEEEFEKFVTRS